MYKLCIAILTTLISVNGQVNEVPSDSSGAVTYSQTAVTDIGDPDNLTTTKEVTETIQDSEATDVSSGDSQTPVVLADTSEMVSLLSDTVELLSENSASVTGTINTTILDMCDRIVDDYPSHYKYAAFRTDTDDSYRTILYIAKKATYDNGSITFSDDCIAVNFYRTTTTSGYSGYIYYDVSKSPNATVTVGSKSIVYTNVIDGYPTIGNKTPVSHDWLFVILLIVILIIVLVR